jgi:hypothetical protein
VRHKNVEWELPAGTPTRLGSEAAKHDDRVVQTALLMDLRDQLFRIVELLSALRQDIRKTNRRDRVVPTK